MGARDPLSVGISELLLEADHFLRQLDEVPRVTEAWAALRIDAAAERAALVEARERAAEARAEAAHWVHEPANVRADRDAWWEDVRGWRKDLAAVLDFAAARPQDHPWAAAGARLVTLPRAQSSAARHAWFRQVASRVEVWRAEHGPDWDRLDVAPRAVGLRQRLDAWEHAIHAIGEPRRVALDAKEASRLALRTAMVHFRRAWAVARQMDPLIPPLRARIKGD